MLLIPKAFHDLILHYYVDMFLRFTNCGEVLDPERNFFQGFQQTYKFCHREALMLHSKSSLQVL